MRALAVVALAALLAGCSGLPKGMLANRVGVSLAQDECRVDSRWAVFGFSTPIDDRDCQVIREALLWRILQTTK